MTVRIIVRGKVQGVFFRASTQAAAKKLELKGFVQNLEDGSVLIEAEGSQDEIESLINWCHKGPDSAIVEDVVVKQIQRQNFTQFVIQ